MRRYIIDRWRWRHRFGSVQFIFLSFPISICRFLFCRFSPFHFLLCIGKNLMFGFDRVRIGCLARDCNYSLYFSIPFTLDVGFSLSSRLSFICCLNPFSLWSFMVSPYPLPRPRPHSFSFLTHCSASPFPVVVTLIYGLCRHRIEIMPIITFHSLSFSHSHNSCQNHSLEFIRLIPRH